MKLCGPRYVDLCIVQEDRAERGARAASQPERRTASLHRALRWFIQTKALESALALQEFEQIGVDLVRLGGAHAMGRTRIDLQRGVLHNLR